jgi:SOS-response transcriptional repressor LexA
MAQNTLGQRMRAAADDAGLKQKEIGIELARRTGRPRPYTEAAVGQWYADKHEPENKALVEFSRLVHADLVWLQTGVGRGLGPLPREGRIVPAISLNQAIREPIDYTSSDMVCTYFPCSEKAFITCVCDDRNAPDYKVGYKIVIDPLRKPLPGKMVLAVVNRQPIFGRFVEKTGKAIVIEALNQHWPAEIVNFKRGDRIVGSLTEFAVPAP